MRLKTRLFKLYLTLRYWRQRPIDNLIVKCQLESFRIKTMKRKKSVDKIWSLRILHFFFCVQTLFICYNTWKIHYSFDIHWMGTFCIITVNDSHKFPENVSFTTFVDYTRTKHTWLKPFGTLHYRTGGLKIKFAFSLKK